MFDEHCFKNRKNGQRTENIKAFMMKKFLRRYVNALVIWLGSNGYFTRVLRELRVIAFVKRKHNWYETNDMKRLEISIGNFRWSTFERKAPLYMRRCRSMEEHTNRKGCLKSIISLTVKHPSFTAMFGRRTKIKSFYYAYTICMISANLTWLKYYFVDWLFILPICLLLVCCCIHNKQKEERRRRWWSSYSS